MRVKDISNRTTRILALYYTSRSFSEDVPVKRLLDKDLYGAFIFADTHEGHNFWRDLYNEYKAKEDFSGIDGVEETEVDFYEQHQPYPF